MAKIRLRHQLSDMYVFAGFRHYICIAEAPVQVISSDPPSNSKLTRRRIPCLSSIAYDLGKEGLG
jgi:hypothetical protein